MTALPSRGTDPAGPGRLLAVILTGLLVWALLRLTEFHLAVLFDPTSADAMRGFLAGFLPPALAPAFLLEVLRQTWLTVAMATCGLVLALALGVPAALVLTRVLSLSALGQSLQRASPAGRGGRALLRLLLVFLRSVPELVWALLLVRVVGLGPAAGVFAIAITYSGMLAKVYAEMFEAADPGPVVALLRQGSGRLQAFAFGLLPQCADELISYTVYRWECGVRTSVVLGFVGAGGLGQMMDQSLKMMQANEVTTLLLMFVLLVGLADLISHGLRRVWA